MKLRALVAVALMAALLSGCFWGGKPDMTCEEYVSQGEGREYTDEHLDVMLAHVDASALQMLQSQRSFDKVSDLDDEELEQMLAQNAGDLDIRLLHGDIRSWCREKERDERGYGTGPEFRIEDGTNVSDFIEGWTGIRHSEESSSDN